MKEINSTTDFDAVLLAVARAACNIEMVNKLTSAHAKRKSYRITSNLRVIKDKSFMTQSEIVHYCSAILSKKYGRTIHLRDIPTWYLDISEEEVDFLVQVTSIAAKRRMKKEP